VEGSLDRLTWIDLLDDLSIVHPDEIYGYPAEIIDRTWSGATSALPQKTDSKRTSRHVGKVPIPEVTDSTTSARDGDVMVEALMTFKYAGNADHAAGQLMPRGQCSAT
jgi:hypothetical protein